MHKWFREIGKILGAVGLVCSVWEMHGQGLATEPVDTVNVMIGTAAEGQTFPATGMPFAMTQWTPQTREGEAKCVAPYYIVDTRIQGFRGSHFLSGSCAQDYGSFTLMPLLSPVALDAEGRSSAFSHNKEEAHPYRYGVDLLDTGIHAEITGSERSGMMKFTFPAGHDTGWLAVEDNVRLGSGSIQVDPNRQEILGVNPVHRIYAGSGQSAGFSGYFVIKFDRPFRVGGTWAGKQRHEGALTQDSAEGSPGTFVSFALSGDVTIRAKIGTSFVSVDEARKNLAIEIPDFDFDAAAGRARNAWAMALDKIKVAGDSPDRRIFYTAMYHAMLLPRIYSDRSGTYPRFASGQPVQHADGFTYYCDYSVWDTFRALHPMLAILDPARELDMVKSLIAKGEQGGFLPIFPAWNSYTSEMVGDHAGAIIADAYVKGIRAFDAEAAYQLMRRNAMEQPSNEALYRDGRGRRALVSYLKYGYIPLEDHVPYAFHKDEQVSRTLEYAFDDYEVSVMAEALGHTEDVQLFSKRAQNYRNVIDPDTGFARGRHADGSWVTPFDPSKPASYVTEGLPWQYTFFVPQDIPGLISAVHGPKAFIEKLDGLFQGDYYDQGNEPSHHIAYLYDYTGEAWKTQQHVHQLMSSQYRDNPSGLSGNDDAGQMSAWYVMSALGFYAVTPGSPRYAIGTPHFDDMRIQVAPGRFLHIRARGAEQGQFYIRSIRLNGTPLHRFYLLHSELLAGGELEFEMSATPVTAAESEKPVRSM